MTYAYNIPVPVQWQDIVEKKRSSSLVSQKQDLCRQLFCRLVDPNHETDLGHAIGKALQGKFVITVGPDGDTGKQRLDEPSVLLDEHSAREQPNCNNLYDNDGEFRDLIQLLQNLVRKWWPVYWHGDTGQHSGTQRLRWRKRRRRSPCCGGLAMCPAWPSNNSLGEDEAALGIFNEYM
ncbi:expressed unknown protein [Seminavis robusta]|uniref:Uncharacterized protein n=1 Tax=Seminavis robusta TaxID=568900 RepID=A0A9N8DZ46_9STRA|nr:expressed unknown protein [Seminavis robusta]|eukprot:Sro485_g152460.1 n/a (178) ;mRNA; f:44280-44966